MENSGYDVYFQAQRSLALPPITVHPEERPNSYAEQLSSLTYLVDRHGRALVLLKTEEWRKKGLYFRRQAFALGAGNDQGPERIFVDSVFAPDGTIEQIIRYQDSRDSVIEVDPEFHRSSQICGGFLSASQMLLTFSVLPRVILQIRSEAALPA